MIAGIISLLTGGFGGGLLALATGVMKLFDKKQEADHEYRMTQLQIQIDKEKNTEAIALAQTQGQLLIGAKEMDAYQTALAAQGKMTGSKFVDGLNALVRPILTYWWMVLFTVYKIGTLYVLFHTSHTFAQFVAGMWTTDDWRIFGTIIGFWFVNRTLFHNHK